MDTSVWNSLVVPGIPVVEKIVRPIIVYIFLIVGLRLAGKRELAQLNPFDLVVLLTISNTVQNAIIGNDNSLTGGLVGAATLLVANYVMVRWTYRHPALERLVEGTPTVLMENGELKRDALARELVTEVELASAAHRHGYLSLEDVDRATLEPDGAISFSPRKSTTRTRRHDELLSRLNSLQRTVEDLRRDLVVPGKARG